MRFATYLALKGLAWQTIKLYLAGTSHYLMLHDLSTPFRDEQLPRLQLLLRGIKRISSRSSTPRPRLPITPTILRRAFRILSQHPSDPDAIMLWAAMNLCFFGFLRSGEICCPGETTFDPTWHLGPQDITVDSITNTSIMYIRIKASKTDPFRLGVTIAVGKTMDQVCPIKAMLPYLAIRGAREGPLFQFSSGSFLSRQRFVDEVRRVLSAAGVNATLYSGHSFRIGAATTAAQVGIQDNVIQTLGRWKSSAYQSYIRLSKESLCQVSSALVTTDTAPRPTGSK